ncbi:MAG: lipoyl(octanoyl) transferase LipB [Bacteroidales bacterium]|nr:lipoyl(octanoyl) transferase LipB [Bacteroidales bacterium]
MQVPSNPEKQVHLRDLGLINYQEAWDLQESLLQSIISKKLNSNSDSSIPETENYLLLCQHPHVFTLGKSGSEDNLLANFIQLQAKNAEFVKTNRGGDITYHGPGQMVGYPILNLDYFVKGIREYVDKLEETIILTLNDYGIKAERLNGATGVWIDTQVPGKTRKICAIGVRVSRGVSMHGFAFNVNTDLAYFHMINPCGFTDKAVTSLSKELGRVIDEDEVKARYVKHFEIVFNASLDTRLH